MDPYALEAPPGWFDVEVAPPPRPSPQQLFPKPQPDNDNNDDTTPQSSSLQEYLQNLVERVEGRSNTDGAPLRPAELAELAVHAAREQEDAAATTACSTTLTSVAAYLYEHVTAATVLSVLESAGRVYNSHDAPSQATAALQEVSTNHGGPVVVVVGAMLALLLCR